MPPWARSILAVAAGVVIFRLGIVVCIASGLMVARGFPGGGFGPILVAVFLGGPLGVCVSGAVSGYVAAQLAGRAYLAHAVAIPLLAWVTEGRFVLFHIAPLRSVFSPLNYILSGLLFCLLGAWIASRKEKSSRGKI